MELWTALLIGFFGSFHCVGMCGPIALALPIPKANNIAFIAGRIIYNLGRVISYSILGAIFGLLGQGFKFYGFQQALSIFLGVMIIVSIFLPTKYKNYIIQFSFVRKISLPIKTSISKLFHKGTLFSLLAVGILNGFLPCGFVYMGLAAAVAAGNIFNGFAVMIFFGLGTIPAMFAISIFGKFINLNVRRKLSKLTPVFALVLAVIFILRGLNLGIPYLSPKFSNTGNHIEMMHMH